MADRRITPARPDLAAAHLKGKVEAERFAEGERLMSLRGHNPLRSAPDSHAEQETELLCGDRFTVYEQKNGWAWGQIASDGYVGYVHVLSLCPHVEATHRMRALSTPLLTRPNIKAASNGALPMNALVRFEQECGDFVQTNAGYVSYRHLVPLTDFAVDFVSVAERFLGAPYVWGGKTVAGLDCSGLIQTALQAAGISSPRDTDMMEKALGVDTGGQDLQRGDLVFWKGHVGVMLNASHLLHANAFHMEVFAEPLDEAKARIAKSGSDVTSVKRL